MRLDSEFACVSRAAEADALRCIAGGWYVVAAAVAVDVAVIGVPPLAELLTCVCAFSEAGSSDMRVTLLVSVRGAPAVRAGRRFQASICSCLALLIDCSRLEYVCMYVCMDCRKLVYVCVHVYMYPCVYVCMMLLFPGVDLFVFGVVDGL